jgi:DNA ligase-1
VGIVKKKQGKGDWSQITYMVYDAPLTKGTFKHRLKIIEESLKANNSKHAVMHKQEVCKDQVHLDKRMGEVLALKGEGLMIKDPKSKYEHRRSKALLKVKKFDDAEATVIGHLKGTGRLENMCGAIQVKNDKGIKFKIGSGFNDQQRQKPPKIGSRVTYKY